MRNLNAVLLMSLIISATGCSKKKTGEFESPVIKVAIVASDLKATTDFYTRVIGMTRAREFDIDSLTGAKFGLTGGVPFHVTGYKLIDSPQATELKIMSFGGKQVHQRSKYIQDDIGVQYLTMYVRTMKPFIERIKANHVQFLGETPTSAGDGMSFVLIQDPNGVFIELIGRE